MDVPLLDELVYRIDAYDLIDYVGENWAIVAHDNDAPQLADGVVGKPLWYFVTDSGTQYIYESLLAKVRRMDRPLLIALRCDTPTMRRTLHLTMHPLTSHGVEFHSRVVSRDPRPAQPLIDVTVPRSDRMVCICSWCKRVQSSKNTWLEVEEALGALGIFLQDTMPLLTHGICPGCFETYLAKATNEDAF